MQARIWLGLLCVGTPFAALGSISAQGDKKDDKAIVVRPLKFAPKDPTVVFMLGGQGKLWTLSDADAVEKLVGKASAKPLIDAVDFKKEAIVVVSWTTSGPPEGTLKHAAKADGSLQFYVQGPPGAKARGQRARIGLDVFAVPQMVKTTFDPKER